MRAFDAVTPLESGGELHAAIANLIENAFNYAPDASVASNARDRQKRGRMRAQHPYTGKRTW